MQVALARPNYYTHLITPPLGVGSLSAYLRARGVECRLVDGLRDRLDADALARACEGADIVGLTCLSDFFPETIEAARALKAAGAVVVIGGPHASALPQETLEQTGADYVVVGEGEQTLAELVDYVRGGARGEPPAGVVAAAGGAFQPRPLLDDLDALPFPDWEQMDPRTYPRAPHGALIKQFPVAPVASTRGCPFACSFCASPKLWGRRIRFRSPARVVDEIEWLVRDFGVREIHFEDDNLTLKREHAEGVCREILRRGLDISWATPNGVRVDAVTPDLLRLMRESGCYYIAFGIESGDEEILRRIRKNTDLSRIEQAVRWAHEAGMITQGFFIFGLPGETAETIEKTIEFAKRLPLDRGQFLLLDLLPGSELWDELRGQADIDWTRRSYQELKWTPDTVDAETLRRAPGRAFRRFFFRPRPLWSLLRFFRPSQLPFVWQRIKDFGILWKG